jgi:bifunctional DNA-binding transcriptional regulator/antitoxin component of YhaV-PrlF toxin-antitoxin module
VPEQMPVELHEEEIPFFAEVIAGGRITIPEEIRKIFEVKDGDHVFCRIKVVRKEGSATDSKQTKIP